MNHRHVASTQQLPTSLELLSHHIQSLPYGEEDVTWVLTVLQPRLQERLSELPWNVQWRIWLRRECHQHEQQQRNVHEEFHVLDQILVTLQGIILQKKSLRDDVENQHDLVMLAIPQPHHHQDMETWNKDFMILNWSTSQRYHVYRDVHTCWGKWSNDQRRDVHTILNALDELFLSRDDGDNKIIDLQECFTEAMSPKSYDPLAILHQIRGTPCSPQELIQKYYEDLRTTENSPNDRSPTVDKKPPFTSKGSPSFESWINSHVSEHPQFATTTQNGLLRLCRILGEQGVDSELYQSVKSLQHASQIFAEATMLRVDDEISYKGLSLLLSATSPDFVPEATSRKIYKPLARVENEGDTHAVAHVLNEQFKKSAGETLCPNVNDVVVFVWDQILAYAIRRSNARDLEVGSVAEVDPSFDSVIKTLFAYRSWLPWKVIIPRYQFLLKLLFEPTDQKTKEEDDGGGDQWKYHLRNLVHLRSHGSLGRLRMILFATTQMIRTLNASSRVEEDNWNLLFNKDVSLFLFQVIFAFGLVLSLETLPIVTTWNDPVPGVFERFFLLFSLFEFISLNDFMPSTALPQQLAWLHRMMRATAKTPIGIVPSQSVFQLGRQLIRQYERIINTYNLENSACDTPSNLFLECCIQAAVVFCQTSNWNCTVSNAWCKTIAHAFCSLTREKVIVGRVLIKMISSCLISESEKVGQAEAITLSPLLRCWYEQLVESVWHGPSTREGLAEVLLATASDVTLNQNGIKDALLRRTLSCILRSTPPAMLFSTIALNAMGADLADQVLRAFGTQDMETACVVLLGISLRIGRSEVETIYEEMQNFRRVVQNFLRDGSNGCLGKAMTKVELAHIRVQVANCLAESDAKSVLECWNELFPCESLPPVGLKKATISSIHSSMLALENDIQTLKDKRQRSFNQEWNQPDRKTPRAHRSRLQQWNKSPVQLKSTKTAPTGSLSASSTRFPNGEHGVNHHSSDGTSPLMVHSAAGVSVNSSDDRAGAQYADDNDSVILLDL